MFLRRAAHFIPLAILIFLIAVGIELWLDSRSQLEQRKVITTGKGLAASRNVNVAGEHVTYRFIGTKGYRYIVRGFRVEFFGRKLNSIHIKDVHVIRPEGDSQSHLFSDFASVDREKNLLKAWSAVHGSSGNDYTYYASSLLENMDNGDIFGKEFLLLRGGEDIIMGSRFLMKKKGEWKAEGRVRGVFWNK